MKTGFKILIGFGSTALIVFGVTQAGKARNRRLLGNINGQLDKDAGSAKSQQAAASAFDPAYYKGYAGEYVGVLLNSKTNQSMLLRKTAEAMAKAIKDGHNTIFPNDQGIMIKEVSLAQTKVKVSYLASVFQQLYGMSLIQFLKDNLSDENVNLINTTVSNMPNL
jgi:hypothetical protein